MPLTEIDRYAGHWPSLNVGEGASVLIEMWGAPRASESRHLEAESVRLRYYDPERNRRTLFEQLDALAGAGGR
jgi:hypothetical protein